MKTTFALVIACGLLALAAAQTYEGCEGTPNYAPLNNGDFSLVKSAPNGKKFTAPYDGR